MSPWKTLENSNKFRMLWSGKCKLCELGIKSRGFWGRQGGVCNLCLLVKFQIIDVIEHEKV